MTTYTIYGASDDILVIEKDGVAVEDFDAFDKVASVNFVGPVNGNKHIDIFNVMAEFTDHGWELTINDLYVSLVNYGDADWSFKVHNRPGYPEDPAITITAPEGTKFVEHYV